MISINIISNTWADHIINYLIGIPGCLLVFTIKGKKMLHLHKSGMKFSQNSGLFSSYTFQETEIIG